MNRSKRVIRKDWTTDEKRVIAKNAGKLPLKDITFLVNQVSRVKRTEDAVSTQASLLGFGLEVV